MGDDEVTSADKVGTSTDRLIRRLAGRYFMVLVAIASLVIIDQVIIQPLLVRLSSYAPAINVAGRQRMLSQKLTKAALAMQASDDYRHRLAHHDEARTTLMQWSIAHTALRDGNEALGIPRIASSDIEREWSTLTPHFDAMCTAAEHIIQSPPGTNEEALAANTAVIVDHESDFLNSMDRIVKLMESEAAAMIFRLRICAGAISAAVIALLLALGWFVIRPATLTIRRQVDQLESQVSARTRELSAALKSLRHEVTVREQAEIKTKRLATQLSHAERVSTMGHLTAGLAHELNQPLAAVANYLEASDVELSRLSDTARFERLQKYVDQAKQAALRAGQIVRRMRDFVRPHSTAVIVTEIGGLIDEVVELCKTEIEHAATDVSLELADVPTPVNVDPIQIQQVLVNVIQNALQAMHNCPAHDRRIEICTSVAAETVHVVVSDRGPGFAVMESDRIFAPFYSTKRDGLGIGLAISRTIVEEHGGEIWAESAPGGGAKVSFTLPLAENHVGSRRKQRERVCR